MVDTLQSNFNIPIQHYVEVNFDSFRDVVDAVGSVPVFFPAPARDEVTGLNVALPGCNQLDGPRRSPSCGHASLSCSTPPVATG